MRQKGALTTAGIYLGLLLFALWSLFPIAIILVTSLRPNQAGLGAGSPFWFRPQPGNYIGVLGESGFLNYLGNSLVVSVATALITTLFGLPAAYALARFDFRSRRFLAQWFLAVRLAPPIAFVTPFFMMFAVLKILDTPPALILVYTTFLTPFSIWLFSARIREVPPAAEEAAMVDGLTRLQALVRVVVPQIRPTIAAVALLNLVTAWNEFLFALILTSARAVTLPVAVSGFFGERGVLWGSIAAAGVLIMLPPVLISIWLQRFMGRTYAVGKV
ncbi:MAG: carbohydrate ABC transporter permease [Desulfosarcinaceae bacterium]